MGLGSVVWFHGFGFYVLISMRWFDFVTWWVCESLTSVGIGIKGRLAWVINLIGVGLWSAWWSLELWFGCDCDRRGSRLWVCDLEFWLAGSGLWVCDLDLWSVGGFILFYFIYGGGWQQLTVGVAVWVCKERGGFLEKGRDRYKERERNIQRIKNNI